MIYLVSYDLNSKPESSYEELIKAIKSYGDYCKPLKSQWFISSSENVNSIYDSLAPHVIKNDRIYVCEIKSRGQGWLDKPIWEWFGEHGL